MSISKLFAIMIAVSMLFAPFAMQSGSAMAAMPTSVHDQAMPMGHCGGQSDDSAPDKMPDKSCCIAMCTAIAVSPAGAVEKLPPFARLIERPGLQQFGHSFLAELPTPPPRRA